MFGNEDCPSVWLARVFIDFEIKRSERVLDVGSTEALKVADCCIIHPIQSGLKWFDVSG